MLELKTNIEVLGPHGYQRINHPPPSFEHPPQDALPENPCFAGGMLSDLPVVARRKQLHGMIELFEPEVPLKRRHRSLH